jgi:hypothetical protein
VHSIPEILFTRISHLQIVCEDLVYHADLKAGTFRRLSDLSDRYGVTVHTNSHRALQREIDANLGNRLDLVIESISARSGVHKLRKEDFFGLSTALSRKTPS